MEIFFKELHGTPNKRVMSVGKVYAGLLMVENYRAYKTSLAKYGGDKGSQKSSFFNRLMGNAKNSTSQTPKPGEEGEGLLFVSLLLIINDHNNSFFNFFNF